MAAPHATADVPQYEAGPMDRVGHLLIRAYNGDDLDPFFIAGHPAMAERPDRLVRACFYYAVVMMPKVTLVFDNDGAGGMCTMDPLEISAVWRTPDILDALGVTFESLGDGSARFEDRPLPPPLARPNIEWAEDPKWAQDNQADETPSPAPTA
ncbi:hypothetical protein [Methylobacterium sp. 092160098-2]|uniref:hypothetical protein n=1 Tax=Methylobacterium sp. 092160098-2 TaxID=3025129 RepID=UPI002381B08A|nr:hypothetical protein [Methylobacterium sp. 092160098-2]MDE4914581.1 hypothetical protein [Methylobacterium sp. 092160098-2]